MSSSYIKTKFKPVSNQNIYPAWYRLHEKGFPPDVDIMKLDTGDNGTENKLTTERKLSAAVSEDEKVQVKL